MKSYKQWILWTKQNNTKLPISPLTFYKCDPTDSKHYVTYETACKYRDRYGIAFVFTKNDPFFFLDIDKCYSNNAWSETANKLSKQFQNAFQEVSDSQTGLHIIGSYIDFNPRHRCKNTALGLELYTHSRFIALTETGAQGNELHNYTDELKTLITDYFFKDPNGYTDTEWSNAPVPEWSGPEEDSELLEKAFDSKTSLSAITNKASFSDLWNANEDVLAACYPDSFGERSYDGSSVDAALAQHLAFWTGKNHERIKNLMLESKLHRDKWNREDYLIRTISTAVNRQKDVYGSWKHTAETIDSEDPENEDIKHAFVAGELLLEYFKDCVYVSQFDKIMIPNGELLNKSQFDSFYSRGNHFSLSPTSAKSHTPEPWKAFLRSKYYEFPKAHRIAFRPDLQPKDIYAEDGLLFVNSYVPINIPCIEGDPKPLTDHIAKLLPNVADQQILISYLAACVQYKGIKFMWAPVLQGTPGNGKSLISNCLEFIIGHRYTHRPKQEELTEKFNGWMSDNILGIIEDALVSKKNRKEDLNIVKPMITQKRGSVRRMRTDAVSSPICCNFFFSTNYKDAIPKEADDRRFAIFFTEQQTMEDLKRDGMTANYFRYIWDWLENRDGYAIVHDWLKNYKIPEVYNPVTGNVAPRTSSHDGAISHSLGKISTLIVEAIEENIKGFSGGWISTFHLRSLFNYRRVLETISNSKQKEILESLGYIPHPGLNSGRVNNPIETDGNKKSRLYVTFNHPSKHLKSGSDIISAYVTSQMGSIELMDLI